MTRRWLFSFRESPDRRRPRLFRNSLKVAVLGLSLGVTALSLTLALVRGVETTLAQGLGRGVGHVAHNARVWSSYAQLQDFVKAAPMGVARAEFVWDSQALVLGPKGGRGIKITGVLPSDFSVNDPYSGRFPLTVDLGKPLAAFLGVKPGDQVSLLMPGVVRGRVPARVLNIVEFGYYEYDSRYARIDARGLYAYLKEHQGDLFASRPGDAYMIRYYLDESKFPFADTVKISKWRDEYVQNIKPLAEKYKVVDDARIWSEMEFRNFFEAIRHDRVSLTLVLALLALVATLNVAATLLVLYLERDRDLAVLVAMGLQPRQLRRWISLQGLALGLASSAIGVVLSVTLSKILPYVPAFELPPDVYNVTSLPFHFSFSEQLGVLLYGTLAGMGIATFLGWRLARTPVLDVLRHRR
ncbi:MAG TPA: FtsX-like permease family protein [Bdellovibrionota bacterium]|nr:FtsX-like permease family protein [Bdellovibrionota bacterium]